MDRERPPPHRQPPDRETAGQAGDGDLPNDGASLGHHIVARYGRSPGVIRMEATLQRFRRTGLFGHDRLPMLSRLSRHWGGINLPYPGSGGPLTFLQRSPFVSAEFAGDAPIGRSTEPVSSTTVDPDAPLSVPDTPRGTLPIARKAEKRMISSGATTPAAPAATEPVPAVAGRQKSQPEALSAVSGDETSSRHPEATESGPAVVRRRRSQPETLSADSGDGTPARPPEATVTATVAPVATPADSRTRGPLPLSPTNADLGRAIVRRRKHPSPEASTRTTAPMTTETGPPLRIGPQFREEESTIRRTVLPLPAAGERRPSTRASAPASPASAPRLISPDRPSATADVIRLERVRREEPSSIAPSAAITPRGDIGTAIRSRHAYTTIATSAGPLPVSAVHSRHSRPSRIDRSEADARAPVGNRPGTSTPNAPETITARSLTTAHQLLEPQATTAQIPAQQPILEPGPSRWSRSADRMPSAAPLPHPTVLPPLTDNAHRNSTAPEARIGTTGTLSRALSPMPLMVQRQPQHHSAGQTPRAPSPATVWRTGDIGSSPSAEGGHRTPSEHRSGSATSVSIEDLEVGTETRPNPRHAGDGERPNVDDLVDKVLRKLMRRLAVEQERRGWQRWF